jgi:hypothetical protein
VIIKKINLSIITYILSLFLLLTALNAVDFNIQFHHYLDFSFIHFYLLGGVLLYALPVSFIIEWMARKVPQYTRIIYKLFMYLSFGILFSFVFMIPMNGISFFSIVVLFQFFIVETLSEKLPIKKLHPFIKGASSAVILFTGIYYIVKFAELFILRINQ